MEELISVVVPIYNNEKYLRQCIDSIIEQSYKNIEIFLINDGSTDNSIKICNEYEKKDDRINVIDKENGGVSSARNIGIEKSKGEWIVFIDSDDWIEKDYLSLLHKKAKEKNADVVLCGYNRVSEKKKEKINASNKECEYNSNTYLLQILNPQTGFGFCHTKLFNRKIIKNIKFDESLVVVEDALFNIDISENINVAILEKSYLYNYRINNNSLVRKFDKNYCDKYLFAMKKIKKSLLKKMEEDKTIEQSYYNFVAFHILLIAVNYCYHPNNNVKNRRKEFKRICNIEEYKNAIKYSNYQNISWTRKIALFTIKYKLYTLTGIISKIRQIQNKGR